MPIDFKSLKSLFILEEEKPAGSAESQASSAAQVVPNTPVSAPETVSAGPARPGQANEKFIGVLLEAMEKANLPGVDYLEYRQSLKSLEKMPMDEQVRYQSAFAMAQAMGATPQKLMESAGHYLDVLKSEQSKFDQALRNQTSERIGNRQEMLQNLDNSIKQKAEQIKQLTTEMEQHRLEMEKLQKEVQDATTRVEITKNDFNASFNSVVAQITSDLESMKRFLK